MLRHQMRFVSGYPCTNNSGYPAPSFGPSCTNASDNPSPPSVGGTSRRWIVNASGAGVSGWLGRRHRSQWTAARPPHRSVEIPGIDHQMIGHIADHLNLHLALGEVPTAVVLTESVEIPSDDDWLDRDGLGVLHDAEGGPGDRGPVAAQLDDRVEHQMTGAR